MRKDVDGPVYLISSDGKQGAGCDCTCVGEIEGH